MVNYPYFRFIKTYLQSKFQPQISPEQVSEINLKSSLMDIDFNGEINNGRYLVLADLGRFNHGFLTGYFKAARKHRFYPMIAGIIAKYRYRIPYNKKFRMTTRIIFFDDKWSYFETKFFYKDKLSTTIFARTGSVLKGKLLYIKDLERLIGQKNNMTTDIPEIVKNWEKVDSNFEGFF
tara:strand:+ start:427 stop:960 length:534 start_codon:yes stop_codon:yes gene_type:complete